MSKFKTIDWEESWKGMPVEAIEYIKSLPEYVEEDFKAITGLDPTKITNVCEMTVAEISKALGKTVKVVE